MPAKPSSDDATETTPLLDKGTKRLSEGLVGGVNAVSGVGNLATGEYGKAMGAYDKFFYKDKNPSFGNDLELAFRATFFVLVCGLPFFMYDKNVFPLMTMAVETGYYTSTSVIYFIFTMYKTTGDTINFAIGGFQGTFLAVFNIWAMNGFMPGGYSPEGEESWWYIGNVWGATFTFLLLYLNFDGNTQVFGLATYMFYWMSFQNFNVQSGFAKNFQIKTDGAAVKELLVASTGIGIAIFAAYVPYPLFAIWRAHKTAKTLLFQLHSTWDDFARYYCGAEKNPFRASLLAKKVAVMKAKVPELQGYIGSAWFECFGMGGWQRQRLVLQMIDSFVSSSFNNLSLVLKCCGQEDFEKDHVDVMEGVKAEVDVLIEKVGEMLDLAVEVAKEGGAAEGTALAQKADEKVKEMAAARKSLTLKFLKVVPYELSEKMAGENIVCSTLCRLAGDAEDFGEKLKKRPAPEVYSWKDGNGIMGLFKPSLLSDPNHINFVLRNWVSIMVCFFVGYNGYSLMIPAYNGVIPMTACLLLSKSVGSAVAVNLEKLQGVVLGTACGQIVYALLAWCNLRSSIEVAIFVTLWGTLTLYMYYHSENYSTMGLLLGVFGLSNVMQGCSDEEYNPTVAYTGIIGRTVAICIMCIVDQLLGKGRASDMARDAFFAPWDQMSKQLNDLFDPAIPTLEKRKGALRGMIASALGLGGEAYAEARYWRAPWPKSSFERSCAALSTLRFTLASLHDAMTDAEADADKKSSGFQEVCNMESFKELVELLERAMGETDQMLRKTFPNELEPSERDTAAKDFEQPSHLAKEVEKAFDAFIAEYNKKKRKPADDLDSLEDDDIADASMLVCSMQGR